MDGCYCLDDISMASWPSFSSLPMSASMENLSWLADSMWVEPTTSLELEGEKGTNATNSTSAAPVIVREGEEKSIDCCIAEEQTDNLIEAYYLPVSASTEKLNAWLDSMLAESSMSTTSATSLTNATSAAPVTVREGTAEKNDCYIVGVHPSPQQPQQSVSRAAENLSKAYLKQKLGMEVSTCLQYQQSVKTGFSVGESSGDQSTVNTEAMRQPAEENMEAKVAKLMKRRESNRVAARRIREKRKDQMEKLQEKVSRLETALVNQNAAAAAEVSQCNAKVASLENEVKMKDDWINSVETALKMVYGKTALELVSMAVALSGSAHPTEAAAAVAMV